MRARPVQCLHRVPPVLDEVACASYRIPVRRRALTVPTPSRLPCAVGRLDTLECGVDGDAECSLCGVQPFPSSRLQGQFLQRGRFGFGPAPSRRKLDLERAMVTGRHGRLECSRFAQLLSFEQLLGEVV